VNVIKSSHNASTFQPYDPAEALGDTAPTTPVQPKPKKNKCGAFGQVLLAVIAVVVATIVTGGVAGMMNGQGFLAGVQAIGQAGATAASVAGSAAQGLVAGAIGGAAGSIASQGIAVATGYQEKFSWNAVGLAAIGGAIGGSGSKLGVGGSQWHSVAARAMVANVITQGIGVATGLQQKFSWAGVAAAGVGAAFGYWAGGALPGGAHFNAAGEQVGATFGHKLGVSMANMLGNAATRSLVEGSDFGDNIIAALPDVIGQTIGEMVAGAMTEQADWEAQFDGMEAEGSTGAGYDDKPFMGLKQNGALNPAKSNSEPGRREWWDLWGMAGDLIGNIFGGNRESRASAPQAPSDVDEEVITVTGQRRMPREMRPIYERMRDPNPDVRRQAREQMREFARNAPPPPPPSYNSWPARAPSGPYSGFGHHPGDTWGDIMEERRQWAIARTPAGPGPVGPHGLPEGTYTLTAEGIAVASMSSLFDDRPVGPGPRPRFGGAGGSLEGGLYYYNAPEGGSDSFGLMGSFSIRVGRETGLSGNLGYSPSAPVNNEAWTITGSVLGGTAEVESRAGEFSLDGIDLALRNARLGRAGAGPRVGVSTGVVWTGYQPLWTQAPTPQGPVTLSPVRNPREPR
jgi:hypothetical protein